MSERETNAERITVIQRMTPPAPGTRSRIGYASLDYLAELVGTNRPHLIQWKNGTEPQPRHRERLAELSQGRYKPDDFRTRPAAAERAKGVEQEMADLRASLQKLEATVANLAKIVRAHERQLRARDPQPTRKAAGSARGGQTR